jgi:type VI secretion system VasI/ImpG family protein
VDPRLLRAYNDELTYLRETAREFGEEHDVVAGYLGPKFPDEPDPYVERLLEGVAFLAARVRLKLDDQFPDFTQHLLQAIQPNYVSPTPSMAIIAFEPDDADPALADGGLVPRLSEITARAPGHETPCRFRTAHAVDLWPIKITEAQYLPSRAAIAPFASAADVRADAGLRLVIEASGPPPLNLVAAKHLPIFLSGSETTPAELYRQLVGDVVAVVAGPGDGTWTRLPKPEAYGFDDHCALLPSDGRSFRGYRILSEYFACPERFLFADVAGLDRVLPKCDRRCEIIFLFSRNAPSLQGAVNADNFKLFATPIINLFEMQLGRTPVTRYEHEHLLIADRTRPLDYEVYRVLEAAAHGSNGQVRPLAPLYAFGSLLYDWREALFYVSRLRLRRLSTREQRQRRRTDYIGSETWISLTSPGAPERVDDVVEVAVRALVTNRELPELLRFGGKSGELTLPEAPLRGGTIVRAPTRPRPPQGLSDAAWRVIAHLTPNYASLVGDQADGPALLRDHLALYGRSDDPVMRRQIDGILGLSSTPVTRRLSGVDRQAFARGLRLRVTLDDAAFENAGMFLFSAVLDRFLAEFTSINTFVETVFESPDQGEFVTWPPRLGLRPSI